MSHFLYNEKFPETLQEWQESRLVHPYTCPHRGDGSHTRTKDLGVLSVVDNHNLKCDDCGYTQYVKAIHGQES